jgi:tetratricopeptide (TPR) repeat protein
MWFVVVALILSYMFPSAATFAQDPSNCERLFLSGQYDECAQMAAEAIERGERSESWWVWRVRATMIRGRYEEALKLVEDGLSKNSYAVRLRLVAYDVFRRNGDPKRATAVLREIDQLAGRASWRYSEALDRVALGRTALLLGADPRQVLELFYDRVRKEKPDVRDVYVAAGELALEKHDEAVAAQSFEEGLKRFADDADLHFGIASAYAESDPARTRQALEAALEANPRHIPSLLFQADHAIDSEQYEEANEWIDRVLQVDPWRPEAWAYRAVLAHLAGASADESSHRANALKFSATDPAVDHLIGRKLSQKYRFAEGAACQRRSLDFDAEHLPAKIHLAQDLLRLGDDDGWRLADAVHQRDRYDITAYNLVTLHDNISRFRLLRDGPLIVRMEPREAELYGDRVLRLLSRARETLCVKYGLEITDPVTVELFPRQSDFAVRTFGMPGGAGYLGVCFGKLVTANSPASQGENPTNWESVLWHEFCHVVTLQLTRNKMPRWLSEGISVYEERQANPAWGQKMTPEYVSMIGDGALVPVGKLSGAFLAPPSARHLRFAYFESSLVVDFLVQQFGHDAMRQVLGDLARDVPINAALERHTQLAIGDLEQKFDEFAHERAKALAPGTDFDREGLPEIGPNGLVETEQWVKEHPTSFWGALQLAALRIKQRKFREAQEPLERAIELYPGYTGSNDPYSGLALVHRELKEPDKERRALERLVELDADAVPALLRLVELETAAQDWGALRGHAEQFMGANPLLVQPHRAMAQAAEQLGQGADAIGAYRKLLWLDPEDPAEVHYRLGRLLHAAGDPEAKRQVLMALEEAPRFSEALQLLLEIKRAEKSTQSQEIP